MSKAVPSPSLPSVASYGVTFTLISFLECYYWSRIAYVVFSGSLICCSHVICNYLQEVLNTMRESESWRRREILCYKRRSN
jgi:hypothetical protein